MKKEQASEAEVIGVLQTLIDACLDGAKGYALAAADATDPAMRRLLGDRSRERTGCVGELERHLSELGGARAKAGREALRGWVEVRAALPSRSDRMILEECDRGETVARKTYEAAMHEVPLAAMPAAVRNLVQRQYAALLAAQADVQKHMWAH